MTEDTSVAASWLHGLASRGVTFTVRNGRLRCHPERAYKDLSDAEIIFLRHHRDEIKAAINAGLDVYAAGLPREVCLPTPTAAPAPEPPCTYCYKTPTGCAALKERDLALWRVFHGLDPVEIARCDAEATEEMRACIGRPYRLWDGLL